MSLDTIGERAGKHPSTVSYWLKKHGLTANGAARHASKGGISRAELEPLVDSGLTIEGIAQHLGIGDTTVRHWLRRHDLKTNGAKRRAMLDEIRRSGQSDVDAECPKHGLVRHVTVPSERRLRCTKCRAEAVSLRRRRVKEMLVAEAGGRCVLCGYARHQAALQFHHLDPKTKSFGLGVRGITRSIEKLREEASKCVLLCASCHAEVEVGAVELPIKCEKSMPVQSRSLD